MQVTNQGAKRSLPGASQASFSIHPLSPIYGAEVKGLDLRAELARDVKQELRRAWHRHSLLLFRGQSLSPDEVDRASSIFGVVRTTSPWGDDEDRQYVSNVDPRGYVPSGELLFHMDFSFMDEPLRGVALYAYEVPPPGAGGDTFFANVRLAYEHLTADQRGRLSKLTIVHTTAEAAPERRPISSEHPIAFPHPVTGEIVLYCSPRHFARMPGLADNEARQLCDQLDREIARPEISYRHQWERGDLLVWDNIMLQHARTDFDPSYRRHLRRTQIEAPPSGG